MSSADRIAFYLRTSSKAQKDEETIELQFDLSNGWWELNKHQFKLIDRVPGATDPRLRYFVDEGYNLEELNPSTALYDLLDRCALGEITHIFISEPNRLYRSRSAEIRGRILDLIHRRDITIITKDGPQSKQPIIMEILSAFGAEDKRDMLRKCHEAKTTWASREGRPPTGRVPFGYNWNRRKHAWEIVPEEERVIRIAAALLIGEPCEEMTPELKALALTHPNGMNDTEVAEALTTAGFSRKAFLERTNHAKSLERNPDAKFMRSSVEGFFREDCYTGTLEYRFKKSSQVGNPAFSDMPREEKFAVQCQVPPILSKEVWARLSERRTSRRKWSTRNLRHEYLVKDKLVCSVCGIALAARPKYARKFIKSRQEWVEYPPFFYYTCSKKQKSNGFKCSARGCHKVDGIDKLVWREVEKLILKPESVEMLQSAIQDRSLETHRKNLEAAIQSTELKVARFSQERSRLNTAYRQGAMTLEELTEQKSFVDADEATLKKTVAKLREELTQVVAQLESQEIVDLGEIITGYASRLGYLTFDERRRIVLTLVNRITITPKAEIDIFFKSFR